MKEGDGINVFVIEGGKHAHIEPSEHQIYDLVDCNNHL